MAKKGTIIIIVIIAGVTILIPAIVYICNFSTHSISEDPSAWGVFGDYLGGILNPLLSIFSTLLLAYISLILSKESSKEASSVRLLEKKQNAYQEIFKMLSLYQEWECSKAKYNMDKVLVEKRYNNLPHKEKDKNKETEQHESNLRLLIESCICENIVLLKRLALYIESIPTQYDYMFSNTFSGQKYILLKTAFVTLSNSIEKIDFQKDFEIEDILDSNINKIVEDFLIALKTDLDDSR